MSVFKILVPIKRVLDYRIRVKIKSDNSDVDLSNCKMSINPFDEIAIEEALQVKDKLSKININTEIILVTIDKNIAQETLRTGLAMGADRAILKELECDTTLFPLQIAKILKKVVESEQPDLVIMGKQSIDGDNNQTGQILAGLLSWSQGTYISELNIDNLVEKLNNSNQDNKKDLKINITREIDGGLQKLELNLPTVLTTDLRLNQPRYPSLPNIMKAKSKKLDIEKVDLNSLDNLDYMPEILEVTKPPARKSGIMVETVEELVDKLQKEAKVI